MATTELDLPRWPGPRWRRWPRWRKLPSTAHAPRCWRSAAVAPGLGPITRCRRQPWQHAWVPASRALVISTTGRPDSGLRIGSALQLQPGQPRAI